MYIIITTICRSREAQKSLPTFIRRKIGNLGFRFFDRFWYLNVTVEPIFGGFLLWVSLKPEPILNSTPFFIRQLIAPIIPAHLPSPLSIPVTIASSSVNTFTFRSVFDLRYSYIAFGSRNMIPSPLFASVFSSYSSRCSLSRIVIWGNTLM